MWEGLKVIFREFSLQFRETWRSRPISGDSRKFRDTWQVCSSHVKKLEVTEMKMYRWACDHTHRHSQDLFGVALGRSHPALHQPCTRLKLSRAAGYLWALQQSAESWVEPQSEIKIAKKCKLNYIWGRVFVNVVSLKYIDMIYIDVGEICVIPMNGAYTINCSMVFVSSDGDTFRL